MTKKQRDRLIGGIVGVIFLIILSRVSVAPTDVSANLPPEQTQTAPDSETTSPRPSFSKGEGKTNALVIRSVDGDTFHVLLDNGEEATVRFLGVNTPETVDPRRPVECFGKEASSFTKSYTDGKRVRLEADPQADEVDKYGRLLRNVFLEDGTDLNALLVGEGYAYAYLGFPLDKTRKAELARLQEDAQTNKRGLWADGVCEN